MILSIIAGVTTNGVIGKAGTMPWHLPADLQHFKQLTMGKPMLMGRKTFDSLGRVLPGRRHIILTRDQAFHHEQCDIVHSIDSALLLVKAEPELMVIGGAELYRQALPLAGRMYLTLINAVIDGDVMFPDFDEAEWCEVERVERPADERNVHALSFVTLDKKK